MSTAILALNAGSSSLKFSLYRDQHTDLQLLASGQVAKLSGGPQFRAYDAEHRLLDERSWPPETKLKHVEAIQFLFQWRQSGQLARYKLGAVGHRVAHGGTHFPQPVLVDDQVMSQLMKLVPLAPLHQPHNLAAIQAVSETHPGLPQVACFDTSFHCDRPSLDQMIALPRRITDAGVRRYGFHGLSYEYIAAQLPAIDPRAAAGRTVVAHLGNGASMCALQGGCSVATTMGFTALDGLPMGTRCGGLDPGVILYLLDAEGMDVRSVEDLLYRQSGLLGVSGVSNDMRDLLASDSPQAREAIDLFVYRIGRELGSLAAALGGLDAVVFTAGIGQHAAPVRARVCQHAEWLGLALDPSANEAGGPRISRADSRVAAWVIPTQEELMIARHAQRLLH